MSQNFSDETQLLLDRAQEAIDSSLQLRERLAQQLTRARRHSFDLEDHHFWIWATAQTWRADRPLNRTRTAEPIFGCTAAAGDRNV